MTQYITRTVFGIMQKRLIVFLLIVSMILPFTACTDGDKNVDSTDKDGLVTIDVDVSEYLENGTVKLTMHNNSTGDFSYTEGYSLLVLSNGTWYEVPFIDPYFSEIAQTLPSGESISTYEYFTERLGNLPGGTYLITRSGELRIPDGAAEDQKYYYKVSASGIFELPEKTVKAEV